MGNGNKQNQDKIVKFTDLNAWQYDHKLVLAVYGSCRQWPKDEAYGLTSQTRRSAVSVTSNLAEGFSRYSPADKGHFYTMAQSSLTELQNQLLIARDAGYLSPVDLSDLAEITVTVHKLITGLIKSIKE